MQSISLAPWQAAAIYSPFSHTAMLTGIACGKSFTGAHFAIDKFRRFPETTGFIGANTYDQLSQATLREYFRWLDYYRLPYVINQIPPKEWGARLKFPSYRNILSVKIGDKTAHAFCRVLSDPDALRGIQFSWYHIDETRDTPMNTHDVILGRMRESKLKVGLVTSTTNGEDWVYDRFVKNARRGQRLYGAMHVRTEESLRLGIIDQEYYDALLHTYTELMIEQELNAKHVNVHGGRAYYASSERNRQRVAPWGDAVPSRERPLLIGCDFNFDPSPHIWMVGQVGPPIYGPKGEWWPGHVHWFGEIARTRCSTPEMAFTLINRYPDFFYEVFGDRSGARATTSNAGVFDYAQMQQVFDDNGCLFTIDTDQGNNPLVRNRIENMNRMSCDATGLIRMTWSPDGAPNFDSDMKVVGWKTNTLKGQGKLDNGGDLKRTHASDGAGYAIWKKFPPSRRGRIISGVGSNMTEIARDQ